MISHINLISGIRPLFYWGNSDLNHVGLSECQYEILGDWNSKGKWSICYRCFSVAYSPILFHEVSVAKFADPAVSVNCQICID